jgi:hypothetical protein
MKANGPVASCLVQVCAPTAAAKLWQGGGRVGSWQPPWSCGSVQQQQREQQRQHLQHEGRHDTYGCDFVLVAFQPVPACVIYTINV